MVRPATLLKKRPWHRCFPVNFANFLRTPFSTEHLRWLLLSLDHYFLTLTIIVSLRDTHHLSILNTFIILRTVIFSELLLVEKTGFQWNAILFSYHFRSNHQSCSIKKLLLKISQHFQENTCVGVSF